MKILHVAQHIYNSYYNEFTKNKTGLGIIVNDICEELAKEQEVFLLTHAITQGHDCEFVILKHTWRDFIASINLKNLYNGLGAMWRSKTSIRNRIRILFYFLDAGYLSKVILRLRPDVIHIHEYTPAMQGFISVVKSTGIPTVITCHGLLFEKECEEYIISAERDLMEDYKESWFHLTTISTSIKEKLINHYQISDSANMHVILNGSKKATNKISESIYERYSIDTKKKIFLCVGQICERKNQMQIVRTLHLLSSEEREKIQVIFVGNDTLNGKLQEEVISNKLEDIALCVGFIDREELCCFYSDAYALVVVSKDEGFGLPIIEAYNYGVPCIIFNDLDAVKDLYHEEAMIRIFGREDVELANAFRKALDKTWDKEKIRRIGQLYSNERMGKEYINLYVTMEKRNGCKE